MPEFQVRRDVVGGRREGRRSLSAYIARARGTRVTANSRHPNGLVLGRPKGGFAGSDGEFNAGVALSLVYPFVRWANRGWARSLLSPFNPKQGAGMKRKPSIKSLETVSLDEAVAYLEHAGGDDLSAAYALALDRATLDGSHTAPDDAEVHHALFLLCRARGKTPPSFDGMRVELRRRMAA